MSGRQLAMFRRPQVRASFALPGELVVDNFAGGGGASSGIEAALGRPVDIAINHDAEAIAMHRINHPETRHFCENIWEVDPRVACGSRPVGLAWFSPDCTHFSRAKGQQPVKKEIRGLAWVVIRWAKTVRPRMIVLENVEEFQTWGPLRDGRPDPGHAGRTFRQWLGKLRGLGYTIEFRTLVAADFGAPTTRKRLYLIARRDDSAPIWPDATHGKGRRLGWRPAADVIDWSLPCPSIFERSRPLADAERRTREIEATLARLEAPPEPAPAAGSIEELAALLAAPFAEWLYLTAEQKRRILGPAVESISVARTGRAQAAVESVRLRIPTDPTPTTPSGRRRSTWAVWGGSLEVALQ